MAFKDKIDTMFFCTNCGYESAKWMGQCPVCREWNTFAEAPSTPRSKKSAKVQAKNEIRPLSISEIDPKDNLRIDTGIQEFSRAIGGGIVPGSLVLLGGDPGVGKSTLLLQVSANVAKSGKNVLYVSGEESLSQIRLRADRIGNMPEGLKFVTEIDVDKIIDLLQNLEPDILVVDSIQTMYTDEASSVPGSVTQVRECAQRLMMCIKNLKTACFLIGHVTKEGTVAGPRVLEHMVDTVLFFESGDQFGYRVLRSAKNRFGSTNEIGVFEMHSDGLREVENPSEYLIEGRPVNAPGSVVSCLMEGTRPMLAEVQGLAIRTVYGMARRQVNGMDYNRLVMLLAILSRRCLPDLSSMDVYVNIAGGLRINQPSADLAVVSSIISSVKNVVIPEYLCIFGEVGLSGEVRRVPLVSERIKEAAKLGFKRIICPKLSLKDVPGSLGIDIVGIRFITELLELIK